MSVAPPLLTAVAPAASRKFFLWQFYQKDTSVCPKKSYIDFGDNFNFGELVFLASLIVGELVCRRVGLSASWTVGEFVCRRLGVSASWFVGELSIKRCSYCDLHYTSQLDSTNTITQAR